MKISFIVPSRNNLKYLKWSFASVLRHRSRHEIEFCVFDDASTDGTKRWCNEQFNLNSIRKSDGVTFYWRSNTSEERLGHTILYDRIIQEFATNELCIIWHADMYLCPGTLDSIEKWMFNAEGQIITNRILSLTRIEPPLHPAGKEKILKNFGIEPEEFDENAFLNWFNHDIHKEIKQDFSKGVFAPWVFSKTKYLSIGGNDWANFAPQSKEDSDIWNRLLLSGCEFIQTWEGFVYHLTCRGSRFSPNLTIPGKNSDEWEMQNKKSERNFIRKWRSYPKNDSWHHPIVWKKYDIGFYIKNCTYNLLYHLEPWSQDCWSDLEIDVIDRYVEFEQSNTPQDLKWKLKSWNFEMQFNRNEIVVHIDGKTFTQNDMNNIVNLSKIIEETGSIGKFELGNLIIEIKAMTTSENNLITCKNKK